MCGIALVADHEPLVPVEHAQALAHIVDGGVEAHVLLLENAVLLGGRALGPLQRLEALDLGGDVLMRADEAAIGQVECRTETIRPSFMR